MARFIGSSGLRANRNWRLLWLGRAVSQTGDYVFDVTIMLWIATVIAKGQPWAPAAVGGALIAAAVPALVVGPFAGVFVDRWNRRRTMMVADAVRGLLIVALLGLPAIGRHLPAVAQVGIIYAVLAAASCFAQFFNPSGLAILGAVVERRPGTGQRAAAGHLQLRIHHRAADSGWAPCWVSPSAW
jgi:MFS family permease